MNRKTVKALICLAILVFSMLMTSCRVNMIDRSYEVAWWVIALPVAAVSFIVFYCMTKHIEKKKYICTKCNESFYPNKWAAVFAIHVNDDRYLKCPCCKKRNFCYPKRSEDD